VRVRASSTFTVNAPIDRVFDYFADPRHAASRSSAIEMSEVSDRPHTYRAVIPRLGEVEIEYSEFAPPTRLTGRVTLTNQRWSVPRETVVEYQLDPLPVGTRVRSETTYRLPIVQGLVFRLARFLGMSQLTERMNAARTRAIEEWATGPTHSSDIRQPPPTDTGVTRGSRQRSGRVGSRL
jgi:uncharacterized protein YndB with AHSA1/START domain